MWNVYVNTVIFGCSHRSWRWQKTRCFEATAGDNIGTIVLWLSTSPEQKQNHFVMIQSTVRGQSTGELTAKSLYPELNIRSEPKVKRDSNRTSQLIRRVELKGCLLPCTFPDDYWPSGCIGMLGSNSGESVPDGIRVFPVARTSAA